MTTLPSISLFSPTEEQKLARLALESAQLGLWRHDLLTGHIVFDERGQQHYGAEFREGLAAQLVGRVHPGDRARMAADMARTLHGDGQDEFDADYRVLDQEGKTRLIHVHVLVDFDGEGAGRRALVAYGTSRDVTEYRQTAQELSRFVHASPSVIYVLAVEGKTLRLLWLGGDIERLTGWNRAEVSAPGWWSSNLHPADRERALASNPELLIAQEVALDFRFKKRDGSYMWLHDRRRLFRDEAGAPREIVGSWSDVTERVELEERYRHAQRLDSIGRLAGGIAHDFNNLLTVILGNCEQLGSHVRHDAELASLVREIRTAGERASMMTRQLLSFGRRHTFQPVLIDVNAELRRLYDILHRLLGASIRIALDTDERAGAIYADAGQFEQVVLNLCVNARDAMPQGGTLSITTRWVTREDASMRVQEPLSAPSYLCLSVCDTGSGIRADVLPQIFDPYFTTKAEGKGSGLGLATVFGIVKQGGGAISVESTVGSGSTFCVMFPHHELKSTVSGPAAETSVAQ